MNKSSNINKSDFAIALIVVFIAGIIIGHYRLIDFTVSLFGHISEETATTKSNRPVSASKMTTYYQWFDINGKMRISRFKPKEVVDFIIFEGSQHLRDVSYPVDKELLAKGLAYRKKLLSGGNSRAETDNFLSNLLNSKNAAQIDSDEHCAGLTGWLSDISQTIARDEAMKKPFCEKYQARLQVLRQIGCGAVLMSFEERVCG